MILRWYLFFWGFILIIATSASGQNLEVNNVRFVDHGETVIIQYNLDGKPRKKHVVSLSLSYDYGKTFPYIIKKASGDIGRGVRSGEGKEIVWRVHQDFPDGLVGDGFVFAVEAEVQKWNKTPLYVVGAGVLGGVLIFTAKKVISESDPTTGTIKVIIPNDF